MNYFKWIFYNELFPTSSVRTVGFSILANGLKVFNETQRRSLKIWFEKVSSLDQYAEYSVQDMFYLYQQIGTWYTYIEQGLDLIAPTSIHLGNTMQLYKLVLSLGENYRKTKSIHYDLMLAFNPQCLSIPFNKERSVERFIRLFKLQYEKHLYK